MLKLHDNEKVIIAFHRHWIVVASKLSFGAFLLIPPIAALVLMQSFEIATKFIYLGLYIITVYLMAALMAIFVIWFDYYLDIWIVTNERIIDIEQIGMFRREVSEFMLSRVQDVTIEIPSFLATALHYGNLRVQTAGHQNFVANDIPHADRVKDIILAETRKIHGRPRQTSNGL